MGVVHIDTCETASGTAIGSCTPDVGTGYTSQLAAATGQWESNGDGIIYDASALSDNALMTLDDEPAANSECRMSFRLDGAPSTDGGDEPLFAVARWTDNDNFYGIGGYDASRTPDKVCIFKVVSGTVTELASATDALVPNVLGGSYEIHVSDSTKELIEGSTSIVSSSDNALTSGRYGFTQGNWLVSTDDCSSLWVLEQIILVELPSCKVFDRFQGTSDVALESSTPFPVGTAWTREVAATGGVGFVTWHETFKDAIRGSTAVPTSTSTAYTITPAPSVTDYDLYAVYRGHAGEETDEPFWLLGRWVDSDNYYALGLYPTSTGDMVLVKKVSGTVTSLASNTSLSVPSDGGCLRLSITDATKAGRFAFQGANTDISSSDNALTAAGEWGCGMGSLGTAATDDLTDATEILAFLAVETAAGGGIDTSESRSGTATGTATGTGRQASQNEKRSTVSATATTDADIAVQDAKRSDVTGTASVTGVSAFSNAAWEKAGTSEGQATVAGRIAVQDEKISTVAGTSTVTGRIAVEDRKRSEVTGTATVTGASDFESPSIDVSEGRSGTSSAEAAVEARIAWQAEIMGNSTAGATVTGDATSTDESSGVTVAQRYNTPLHAYPGRLMNR